uniref:Uncharacterized protein n=1 Tax=Coccolithus braarudii TaxID=221442 RepID=A0A7S0PZF4_9EUKA
MDREGARRLLSLAYPVTAVFDDLVNAIAGGQGAAPQEVSLRQMGISRSAELRAVALMPSAFAQWSLQKVPAPERVRGSTINHNPTMVPH